MSFSLPHLETVSAGPTIRDRIRRTAGRKSPAAPPDFPVSVDGDLVAELATRFPNTCPGPGEGPEAMYRIQGQQDVIMFLLRIFEEQNPGGG